MQNTPNRYQLIIGASLFALLFLCIGFQILRRFIDDDLPDATVQPTSEAIRATSTDLPAPTDEAETTEAPTPTRTSGTVDLALGRFYSVNRDGSGEVEIIEFSDGTRFMRFDPFTVQDGADLRVVLVAINPVPSNALAEIEGGYDLGELYTTRGAQNYPIPAEVDLSQFRSVVVWSASMRIVFTAAPLTPP